MKPQVSLASWPVLSHEEALAEALQGAEEPMFGPLGLEHVQLVPQCRGILTEEVVARLRTMAPGSRFRLHANVRVLPEHRFADLTNAHEHWDYFLRLAEVHRACGASIYTAHSGARKDGSWQQTLANIRRLEDLLGCPVGIEGQYPSSKPMHLSRWHEYTRLLEEDVYYVIDLSHLNIVAAKSGRYETVLVRELLACERCIEVHLSDNDGSGDWHALCARQVWWMDLLDAIHPGAVVFSEGNQRRRDKMLGVNHDD